MEATRLGTTLISSFLASIVECVEALTVVLAVGSVRGWRSALTGAGAALFVLAALVATAGPALASLSLHGFAGVSLPLVELLVGALMLLFGLRWLRKAILRAAGLIPLHDEEAAFRKSAAAMRAAANGVASGWDKFAFAATFHITMIEGTEVVFLVLAFGAGGAGMLLPASLGAAAALMVVTALGVALHRPLTRIPENSLKFLVGGLLSGLGTFWAGEGAGYSWLGSDLAIVWLIGGYLAVALCLVRACQADATAAGV